MPLEFLRRSGPNPPLRLHPGINFSSMEVGGDLGGLVFTVGSVVSAIIGLPFLGWFFGGAIAGGFLLAAGLWRLHQPQS